jgi:uncharacterized membrane protein
MQSDRLVNVGLVRLTLKTCLLAFVAWVGALIYLSILTYFPPQFAHGFLRGRQAYFYGWYGVAFYAHIISAPAVLLLGLVQSIAWVRTRYPAIHRKLGLLYVWVALIFAMPSGLVMSLKTTGGISAALPFAILGIATIYSTTLGLISAQRCRYIQHQRWMTRSFLLMGSAVTLRMLAETVTYLQLGTYFSYGTLAWLSWVPALAFYEVCLVYRRRVFMNRLSDT